MKTPTPASGFYSTTPCNECGGPTLDLRGGSIWCANEDAHPGGHFVKRVAFERSPLKDPSRLERTGPRVRKVAEIAAKVERERKPIAPPAPTYGGGMDDFVRSEDK